MEPFSFLGDQQQPGAPNISGVGHTTGFFSNPNPADSHAGPDSADDYSQTSEESALPTYYDPADLEDWLRTLSWQGFEGPYNVLNPEPDYVPVDVSRSSTRKRWPNVVWLVRACYRFSHPAAAGLRPEVPVRLKGVLHKNGKYKCEVRISKKIQKQKRSTIDKVWLGTFKTPVQAARALDVGKYFFTRGATKKYYDPRIEALLSATSQQLHQAEPLDVLKVRVKHLAKHYAMHGTLP